MRSIIGFLILLSQLACAGPATQPIQSGSVRYEHDSRENPPLHVHVITVDLTAPGVFVVVRAAGDDPDGAGPWETTLATVRAVAQREDLDVAINGDFFASKDKKEILGRQVAYFDGNWAQPIGATISNGQRLSNGINNAWPALCILPNNKVQIVSRPADIPKEAREVVGGSTILVAGGKPFGAAKDLAPRTAAGVDREGKRLILVVVDGRRKEYSVGLTILDLAKEMVRLGAWSAINLDGGGSSTMLLRDPQTGKLQLMNRPSDGNDFAFPLSVERPVANVLGVRWKKPQ